MKNLDCIIQARLSSTRYPNKVIKLMSDKRVLHHVIDRVKAVNILEPGLIRKIIVAIPKIEADELLNWLNNNMEGISVVRGNLKDVLKRYYDAAVEHGSEHILRITADCPLLNPLMVYGLIKNYEKLDKKLYSALNFNAGWIPDGWDCELFPFKLLEKAYKNSNQDQKENVSTWMRENSIMNEIGSNDMDFSAIKLSVDTEEDLEFMTKYYEAF